ncbi:hypothetical protein CASFOL_039638 [Castilleja foliolosa]|uniref:Late embryogenesis abundant protein LEA-2 subgroup domain-containing protein n=1 Tax=Castilleja foliolosa TaxID=1961234 RepID=A0ABD3BGA4_9LAMI
MAGSSSKSRQPPPPALQKSLSRRVSFNEATLKTKAHNRPVRPPPSIDSCIDTESQISTSIDRTTRRRGGCSSCCACTSIIIAVLVTLFLLIGGIFFAFLQSNLPEVRLQRLDVNQLVVNGETLVAGDFEVRLNATNDSGKVELGYRGLKAALSSAGVELGNVHVEDMNQQPQNTTEIKIRWVVKNLVVEEAAGKDLLDNNGKRMLVISVVVKGHVDLFFGGKRLSGVPFKIDCHSIDQTEIDDGHAPKCNTSLSPLS